MKPWLIVLLAAGCDLYVGHHAAPPPDAPAQTSPPATVGTNDLDILFVISNAARTADRQTAIAQAFASLQTALDAFPMGRPNLHVGFIDTTIDLGVPGFSTGTQGCPSPDPGDNGLMRITPTPPGLCPAPSGRFIVDVAAGSNGRLTNYPPTAQLSDVMACIGQVGTTGCGFDAPLEAIKRALDGTQPANAGFLRADSVLLVVIVTARDDCSGDPALYALPSSVTPPESALRCAQFGYTCDQPISPNEPGTYTGCTPAVGSYLNDVAGYRDFLATLKAPSQIVIATIAGPASSTIAIGAPSASDPLVVEPSCTGTIDGNPTTAQPADRLAAFQQLFARWRFYPACQSDYASSFTDMLGTAYAAMTTP